MGSRLRAVRSVKRTHADQGLIVRALLLAVGRMKKGPERELAQRYGERLATAGRSVGLTGLDMVELPESRATQPAQRQGEETQSLLAKVPDEAALIVFDERGRTLDSPAFAKLIGDTIDVARQPVVVIGGADGLDGTFGTALRLSSRSVG